MGDGLATSPKLDKIPLARERGMSEPVKVISTDPVEVS